MQTSGMKATDDEAGVHRKPEELYGFYCGRHLKEMGYANTSPDIVYMIHEGSEGEGYFFRDCSRGGCTGVPGLAYCPCEVGKHYCGYEVKMRVFIVPWEVDHTLYRCKGPDSIGIVQNCSDSFGGRCMADETGDSECVFGSRPACKHGLHYCGLELAAMQFGTWKYHTLYECVNGTEVRTLGTCISGCIHATTPGDSSYCDVGRTAYLPSNRTKDEL